MRALAVSGARRSSNLPAVPTMAEAGVPGYEATTWYALLAPAGVRSDVATRLNMEIGRILADPAVIEKLSKQGIEPMTISPRELANYMTSEIDKWSAEWSRPRTSRCSRFRSRSHRSKEDLRQALLSISESAAAYIDIRKVTERPHGSGRIWVGATFPGIGTRTIRP